VRRRTVLEVGRATVIMLSLLLPSSSFFQGSLETRRRDCLRKGYIGTPYGPPFQDNQLRRALEQRKSHIEECFDTLRHMPVREALKTLSY
jgi:hypothetical protein